MSTSLVLTGTGGSARFTGGEIDLSEWVQAAAEKLPTQKIIADQYGADEGRRRARVMTEHYQNMLAQIKEILKSGTSTEDDYIGFRTVDGKFTGFDHGWEELTSKYRRAKRPQYQDVFWKNNTGASKRGGGPSKPLLQSFNAEVKVAQYRVVFEKAAVKRGSVKKTATGASMVVSTKYSVVGNLPEPLDSLVREPFWSGGKEQPEGIEGMAGGKFDLSKLVFVEGRRPFIADMAAILGRFMYKELSLTK